MTQIVIELEENLRYARGHGYQLSISEEKKDGSGHGYRIFGPKYDGQPTRRLRRVVLDEHSVAEIRRYLDRVVAAQPVVGKERERG